MRTITFRNNRPCWRRDGSSKGSLTHKISIKGTHGEAKEELQEKNIKSYVTQTIKLADKRKIQLWQNKMSVSFVEENMPLPTAVS